MNVTRIEAVTKTKCKVYIDGQATFVLYRGELSRFHIKEDAEISEETYREICDEVLLKRAKLRAMHLLESMGRTESQLRDKLIQGEYPPDIIEKALTYVKSFGYVNDLNYALSYIRNRKDKKSKRELQMHLRSKGVAADVIEQAFEECYDTDDISEAITRLLIKRKYHPREDEYEQKKKHMAYLVRKGFSYEDVRRVIENFEQF